MATFSDDFNTDPTSRWTKLWGGDFGTGIGGQFQTGSGGSYYRYNTAAGAADQYVRFKVVGSNGGAILRCTGTASDGFYIIAIWDDTVYFQRGSDSGYLAEITTATFATADNDVVGVTITGTGTGTTVRLWLNPTNTSPVDASHWNDGTDTADASMTASGGTYYDTGTYVGLGVDTGGVIHDDFYGGSIATVTDTARTPTVGSEAVTGKAPTRLHNHIRVPLVG